MAPYQKTALALTCFLMFFLFGCARKNETAQAVHSWLEKSFPGQFEVLKTSYAKNQWISPDKNTFRVVLASKADPAVQFTIIWDRSAPDGGITDSTVHTAYQYALSQVDAARSLYAELQKRNLLASVGVNDTLADIWVFTESAAEIRENVLHTVTSALAAWPHTAQTEFQLLFMEPASWEEDYQKILPPATVHTLEQSHWQQDNCTFVLRMQGDSIPAMQELKKRLRVNPRAKRASAWLDTASQHALKWADRNLQKPFYVETKQYVGEQVDPQDPTAVRYWFPYFLRTNEAPASTGADPDGQIVVIYQTEKNVCTQVFREKEDAPRY
ncbi:MAG: hypothetical protein R3D58_13840 [Saprospiraceae bacterium]